MLKMMEGAHGKAERSSAFTPCGDELWSILVISLMHTLILSLLHGDVWVRFLWTWSSGGLGTVKSMVGPEDLKALFQPK